MPPQGVHWRGIQKKKEHLDTEIQQQQENGEDINNITTSTEETIKQSESSSIQIDSPKYDTITTTNIDPLATSALLQQLMDLKKHMQ